MRIHSNLPEHEFVDTLNDARKASGVRFEKRTWHGSRTHERAVEVLLEGESGRAANNRHSHYVEAATWDQWGIFLAVLYEADPTILCGLATYPTYANDEDFNNKTGARFDRCAGGESTVLSQDSPDYKITAHRWEYDFEASQPWSGGRTYYCKGHSAKKNKRAECHAVRVF